MVTYVLGAGASLHAGYPLTVDLGNSLHAWVCQNDFTSRGYIEELHEQNGGLADLERILTDLHERPVGSWAAAVGRTYCGSTLGGVRVAIPEYFYRLRQSPIKGPDLYLAWARGKVRSGDVILTFNYDLACERALRTEGLWEIGDGYGFLLGPEIIPPSKVKVLKLHGSTNWLGMLFGGNRGFSQVSSGAYGPRPCLFGGRDFSYLDYPDDVRDPHAKGISSTGGDPALILPTLHKNFFQQTSFGREWEPFWNYMWSEAAQALNASEKIVVIGYSMPRADERARELLLKRSNHKAEILVFSGSTSSAICEEFRKERFRSVTSWGRGYFEDFLEAALPAYL